MQLFHLSVRLHATKERENTTVLMKEPSHIAVFGLSHNTASVDVREQVHISEAQIPAISKELIGQGLEEAVILSTCNRTEIYFAADNHERALARIREALKERFKINPDSLENCAYALQDRDAYRHLFLVASGLDSMVIGEPQILGQVKDAYRVATGHHSTGLYLDKIFHRTFSVAKRIRTETRIGYNPVSISSMAVELSRKIFGDLTQKKILVIGAGEMCEIAIRHFKKDGLRDLFITNRTFEKAQRLADEAIGTPRPFSDIPSILTMVDVVLSSTGADEPIVSEELVRAVMKKRRNRPLFFIDIAVPRDVEPGVNHIENVYLYDIDDLRELSQKHLSDRHKESQKAHAIVEEEVERFTEWLTQLDKTPLITQVIEKAEKVRQQELRKSLKKLHNVDEETARQVDMLTKSIVNKLIHPHVSLIREDGSPMVLEIVKKLFRFEEEDEKEMGNRHKG
jgi:glutamyl-tRNA reductase